MRERMYSEEKSPHKGTALLQPPAAKTEAATEPATPDLTEAIGSRQPADVLQLHTAFGNQAVQRMIGVQREGEEDAAAEPAAAALLSKGQVATALSFYKSNAKYTPEIISKIQEKIGTPVTGVMTEVDVQAVAAWQQSITDTESPSLKVDGMVGPRTLPTLFREGLAGQDQIENYVGEAREILDKWEDLGTAEARINALTAKVNEYLKNADVPECGTIISDAEGNLGQFEFSSWSLDIGKPAFEADTPTPAEKADMADTIYHESRHAEQWYRMAQFQASQGKSAADIATDMGIPDTIAQQAFDNPVEKGSVTELIAEGWNESVYGSKAKYRNKVLKELSASGTALEKAQDDVNKNPTKANQAKLTAAQARRRKALDDYFNLPEENDANRIGGRVTKEYMATEPEAEAEATP